MSEARAVESAASREVPGLHDRAPMRAATRATLLLSIAGCGGAATGPVFPLADGTTVPLPAECWVEPAGARPYQTTFDLRNAGSQPLFLAIDYNCGPMAAVSSCARGFKDDLLGHGALVCPCSGSCPVGGPGCGPAGKELVPGAHQSLIWQATIPLQSMRNGDVCAAGSRDLPAGRYRLTAPVFASEAEAIAGGPVLFTLSHDFELPAAGPIDVPFSKP